LRQNEELERVVAMLTLDAPGLCFYVNEAYPLIRETLQFNDTLSWNNMLFRIAVSQLDNLGQHHALVRYSRDPMKNDEHLMPLKYLEQIKSKIADILASSNKWWEERKRIIIFACLHSRLG
jgi:hypothetical protein